MTKKYKINGKEIEAIQGSDIGNGMTVMTEVGEKFNQLLEALSDKEEYRKGETFLPCPTHYKPKPEECNCETKEYHEKYCKGTPKQEECKHNNEYIKDGECMACLGEKVRSKQSISLKEEMSHVLEDHFNGRIDNSNTADKILSLLQSHLIKEIKPITNLNGEIEHVDIIKIINNITK